MPNRRTTEDFIRAARKKHGDRYDYSRVVYHNNRTNVEIICVTHGPFPQTPTKHLDAGQGCPKCNLWERKTTEEFITQARQIHGDKYDYTETKYASVKKPLTIICKQHGPFEQTPDSHINSKAGCPECDPYAYLNQAKFIAKARKIHGDKYDYSKTIFIHNTKYVTIGCQIHGDFEQAPRHHISSEAGCPYCHESKGEEKIKRILDENMIEYVRQKTFAACRDVNVLRFDFYLPGLEVFIERDGIQHEQAIEFFGGEEKLRDTQKKDRIKDDFARKTGRLMWRVKHNEDIEKRMEELFDFLQLRYEASFRVN